MLSTRSYEQDLGSRYASKKIFRMSTSTGTPPTNIAERTASCAFYITVTRPTHVPMRRLLLSANTLLIYLKRSPRHRLLDEKVVSEKAGTTCKAARPPSTTNWRITSDSIVFLRGDVKNQQIRSVGAGPLNSMRAACAAEDGCKSYTSQKESLTMITFET